MKNRERWLPWFVVFVLLASALTATPALASLTQCRSDPLVRLSNYKVVHLTVDIGTALENVTDVSYVLHVPTGLTVESVIYTGNWPDGLEHVTVYADNPAGQYDAITVALTANSPVSVTVQMRVGGESDSASGLNGQSLSTTVLD